MGFVPLHNHSDYSLLDGASQISKIVDRASDLGMNSIALTDHGVMYGVLDLVKKCKEKGIKPVSYTHSDAADERSSVDLGGRCFIKKKKKKKANSVITI